MKMTKKSTNKLKATLMISVFLLAAGSAPLLFAGSRDGGGLDNKEQGGISHVLLISIDGMHAVDFANCANGISGVNGGKPYCPNLAALAKDGVNYLQALASKPSDSFPGTVALLTGATPRSAGAYYDVSYDHKLSPPKVTTPYGIIGDKANPQFGQTAQIGYDSCQSGIIGTQVGFDEEIDINYQQLDAGGGINPDYLPRDPNNNCNPVYPHDFVRVNSVFDVVNNAGGYTAWSDKHPTYTDFSQPTDGFAPEINSIPAPLPSVQGCSPLPDQTAVSNSNSWTDSFQNIQCYDSLKVQAVVNWINGKTHDGSKSAPVPNVFGMNFQAVSVGEKLVEKSIGVTGGYQDPVGTPSTALLGEIQYVDSSIGSMIEALRDRKLLDSTLIVISAKHGQSPIDPKTVLRIPADNSSLEPPSSVLGGVGTGLVGGGLVGQALEDDISLIWLTDQTQTAKSVGMLEANIGKTGGGEIFSGPLLGLMFPLSDSRTPDIIVAPNVGVVYTGGTKKIAEHGGFANDDRNVMLLVSNPSISAATVTNQVETRQIAPTILTALGLDPDKLQAVQQENTTVLPQLPLTPSKDSDY